LLSLVFAPVTRPAAAQGEGVPKIAFITADEQTDQSTIMLANPDGSNVQPFLTHWTLVNPVWSPDGRHLAFAGSDGSNPVRMNIYVIDSDGSNLRVVSGRHFSQSAGTPVWSSDSQQLMYPIYLGYAGRCEIYRVNLDGTGEQKIAFPGDAAPFYLAETWLAWSPDGDQIAFHATDEVTYDQNGLLYIAHADASDAQLFPASAPDGAAFNHLSWSPDGSQVLLSFLNGAVAGRDMLAVANPDGSNLRMIQGAARNIWTPAWSPDGSQVVFAANEAGNETMPDLDLWVVNADGSNLRSLNIDVYVTHLGTSWGLLPADVVLPTTPIILKDALSEPAG
jgi:Tol biopolymer transport system component